MKFSSFLLALIAPVATFAVECLNEEFTTDPLNITAAESRRSLTTLRTRDLITIDLWIHVIASGPTADKGYVDATKILKQVDVLQRNFKKWGFQFQVKPLSYAINAEWAKDIDIQKEEKMKQLHRGDYQSLNVYLVEKANSGVCSLPDGTGADIDQKKLDADGCFVSLDAGTSDKSGTLTHEVGHWFGLLHVFQGGCDGDGDFCDDTAPQKAPSYGKLATPGDLNSCPAKQSCKAGSFDNVKNFMDYSDCCHEFTPCQGGRMMTAWTKYRKNRKIAAGVRWK
ncbi:hypothetical protein K469DRAFT_268834 [Zopfia rhizophila CBS 207.26]|uniref:Peptidase M43 pregnancy-associated plasma-A domain-containing protein n=1 Tax=Zopfia rhizophila CBS 207.26 TaxID=1314779 RepID=A0A6A6DRV3_9PEZI|nr:hypothetical protein K469DRAFT_268834 [Zopfia rhizophila CBS 207.26]